MLRRACGYALASKGTTRRILDLAWASIDTAHRSIQHTVHYSELSPTPFKDFWRDSRVPKGAFAALRTDMYKDWDADPERFKRSSTATIRSKSWPISTRCRRPARSSW